MIENYVAGMPVLQKLFLPFMSFHDQRFETINEAMPGREMMC
jgi:hypothetical protein